MGNGVLTETCKYIKISRGWGWGGIMKRWIALDCGACCNCIVDNWMTVDWSDGLSSVDNKQIWVSFRSEVHPNPNKGEQIWASDRHMSELFPAKPWLSLQSPAGRSQQSAPFHLRGPSLIQKGVSHTFWSNQDFFPSGPTAYLCALHVPPLLMVVLAPPKVA